MNTRSIHLIIHLPQRAVCVFAGVSRVLLASPQLAGMAKVPQLGAARSPSYRRCSFGGSLSIGDAGSSGTQDVAMSIVCRWAQLSTYLCMFTNSNIRVPLRRSRL